MKCISFSVKRILVVILALIVIASLILEGKNTVETIKASELGKMLAGNNNIVERDISECTVELIAGEPFLKDGEKILDESEYIITKDETIENKRTIEYTSVSTAICNAALNNEKYVHEYENSSEWINSLYNNLGLSGMPTLEPGLIYYGWQSNGLSTDKNNIPVGATVYGTGYVDDYTDEMGTLAIYLGNGEIICLYADLRLEGTVDGDFENVETIDNGCLKMPLSKWIQYQKAEIEGHKGFLGWGWSDGADSRGTEVNYIGTKTAVLTEEEPNTIIQKDISECTIELKENDIIVKDGDKVLKENVEYIVTKDELVDNQRNIEISSISSLICDWTTKISDYDAESSYEWINLIYDNIGLKGCANNTTAMQWRNNIISLEENNIPIGATLYGSGFSNDSEEGTLAIYIGNDEVMSWNIPNDASYVNESGIMVWATDPLVTNTEGGWKSPLYRWIELQDEEMEGLKGFLGWGWSDGSEERGTEANYIGTKKVVLTEEEPKVNIENCDIKVQNVIYIYDGKAKKSDITVTYKEKELEENTDYTIEYMNNTNVGEADIIITGIGDYEGTRTEHFTITKKNITIPTAVEGLIYNGEEQTGVIEGEGYTLTGNKATDAGEYTAVATLTDKDNTQWSDESTEDKNITWIITGIEIEAKEEYEVKKEEKAITNIQPNTKVDEFKEKIIANQNYEIKEGEKILSEVDKLKTGQVLKIGEDEYTIIINGDSNGDGNADIKDILRINKHRLNKSQLADCYLKAGDTNKDGKVDIKDILRINKFRLGKINEI